MTADVIRLYLRRAKDFYEAMTLLDEPDYTNAAALLAIHSAISNADPLRLALGSVNLGAADHGSAPESLTKLLRTRGFEDLSGIQNLRYLLSMKSAVAYGATRIDAKENQEAYAGSGTL